MLVGSGPEGTFGSEIPANDDGWEKEGGIMGGVCPASVLGEGVSPAQDFQRLIIDYLIPLYLSWCSFLLFLQTILVISLIANLV